MYSIGASPFNSAGSSLYGGLCDPMATGGALYGGFEPGRNTNDWLDLLQTQKFLSLKRRFNGLTDTERARRKIVNKIIMKGTLDKNRDLKMARLIAAQKGNFGYVPPSEKERHYWTQTGADNLEIAKRQAWDMIRNPNVRDGEAIAKIVRDYETYRDTEYQTMPTDPPAERVDWSKAFNPTEYDTNGTFFSGFTPSYENMVLDAQVAARARAIRKERRIRALERFFLNQGWSRPAAAAAANEQADMEERAEAAGQPPPLPAGLPAPPPAAGKPKAPRKPKANELAALNAAVARGPRYNRP